MNCMIKIIIYVIVSIMVAIPLYFALINPILPLYTPYGYYIFVPIFFGPVLITIGVVRRYFSS